MPRNKRRLTDTGFGGGGFTSGGTGDGGASSSSSSKGYGNLSPFILSPFHGIYSIGNFGFQNQAAIQTLASAAPSSTNRAIAYPFWLPTDITYTQAWWHNGATVAGNVEIGVYNADLTKNTTTGSVVAAGISSLQFQATNFVLTAGSYFLWVSISDGTHTFIRDSISSPVQFAYTGSFMQDSVGPGSAPNPAVPVQSATANVILCGLSTRTF